MSTENKSTFASTATKAAAIAAGAVAAVGLIDQGKVAERLPKLWESIKGIAATGAEFLEENAKKFRPVAFRWLSTLWFYLKLWLGVSMALILGGIHVKTEFGSDVGHILVAGGTVSFAGLGIVLFALSDGIAAILFFKFKVIGGALAKAADIAGIDLPAPTPDELKERAKKLAAYRDKVRLILAGTTVLCFSMLFTMFFPAWSTLGWTLCFWAMVGVALVAALHLKMEMGKAVMVVYRLTIGLIAATFVVFLIDRLTGGAIGFAPVQKWMRNVNGSEVMAGLLVLIPLTLLIVSVFAKEKDTKSAFRSSAKYVGIGCGILGAFLLYKGTISWKELTGKDAPKAVTEIIEKAETASIESSKPDRTSPLWVPSPRGTTSNGGIYMTPPTGNTPAASPQTPTPSAPARAATRRARKPLPKEEPKTYSNLTQGIDDLEALGY